MVPVACCQSNFFLYVVAAAVATALSLRSASSRGAFKTPKILGTSASEVAGGKQYRRHAWVSLHLAPGSDVPLTKPPTSRLHLLFLLLLPLHLLSSYAEPALCICSASLLLRVVLPLVAVASQSCRLTLFCVPGMNR